MEKFTLPILSSLSNEAGSVCFSVKNFLTESNDGICCEISLKSFNCQINKEVYFLNLDIQEFLTEDLSIQEKFLIGDEGLFEISVTKKSACLGALFLSVYWNLDTDFFISEKISGGSQIYKNSNFLIKIEDFISLNFFLRCCFSAPL